MSTRIKVNDYNNTDQFRIDYILKKISKEELADKTYRSDKLRRKYSEILNVYELISVVGIEQFAGLINCEQKGLSFIDEVIKVIKQLISLFELSNKQMAQISVTYNFKVPMIMPNWETKRKKYTRDEYNNM